MRRLPAKEHLTRIAVIYPQSFSAISPVHEFYLHDPAVKKLIEFFDGKGLSVLKEEDRLEAWYDDWLAYVRQHKIYADLLTPRKYSQTGGEFDLLRLTRFLEVFGYFSPAHGYSLQVTFLGLFSILMGSNDGLRREAVELLQRGELFAFGVSEREHGSDLLGNEFTVRESSPGQFVARGKKYYIGNSNCAGMISILARKQSARSRGNPRRAPMMLFALRPGQSPAMTKAKKIRTIGVHSAFVGEFEVNDHPFDESDIVAEGRAAWDAIFGTVTLGKFCLGFGSIGICEHAFEEAIVHLSRRMLYGAPAINLPHIRMLTSQAYVRLTAMKLYAYRALDYLRCANEDDRRYQLYCAVQKAKVGTEGVKVMALLGECMGAKAFEADTYFEMALRDAPLIPSLEGSTHINLDLVCQFIPAYFRKGDATAKEAPSLSLGEAQSGENPYLFIARTGGVNTIAFSDWRRAFEPLMSIENVRLFAKQTEGFASTINDEQYKQAAANSLVSIGLGQCLATIAYAQLIAENATRLQVPPQIMGTIFHELVLELSDAAVTLASSQAAILLRGDIRAIPRYAAADWDFVFDRLLGSAGQWAGG